MTRRTTPVEVNSFVAGLVTDASPLTFPDNASLAEENFVLNRDGSRRRRLGMDYESSYSTIDSGEYNTTANDIGRSSFKWGNAGGDPDKSLLAVQIGTRLDLFDLDNVPVSGGLVASFNLASDVLAQFSYAEIDGLLVVASGLPEVAVFTYEDGAVTLGDSRIRVRDLFGVEDVFDDEDLFGGSGAQTRPSSLEDEHTYNLRNQGWGVPRLKGNDEVLEDPITTFTEAKLNADGLYPSNSDLVSQGVYADPNDEDDRIVNRFFANEVYDNPIGTTRSGQGHYIIDLFNRGTSRLEELEKSKDRYQDLDFPVTSLPLDSTPAGITVVTEFAGRAWYAGFSGEVNEGDERSPRLSSYIAFSRLAETSSDLTRCFQEADPTAIDQNDLVDTDGGFIRIDGAYGIKGLVNIGAALVVLAQNGVWTVQGGSNYGFTAVAYRVDRLSEHGCRSKNSIIVVDSTVMYWGDDGIYHLTANDFGDRVVTSLTQNRIQRLYDGIEVESKNIASGYYDTYERKVRWLYDTSLNSELEVKELVLDINLQAFYLNTIKRLDGFANRPIVVVEGNPYIQSTTSEDVISGSEFTLSGSDPVVIEAEFRNTVTRELVYITVIDSENDTIKYSFSTYRNTDFLDWFSSDVVGVDTGAFLVTGFISGGDFYRDKQLRYLQTYLEQTETIFVSDDDDYTLLNPSSCTVRGQWNWTNNRSAGRWSNPKEFYKFNRHYMSDSTNTAYQSGNRVVVSKDKIRGYGKVLSLEFSTKPGHDCHIHGWSMLISIEAD